MHRSTIGFLITRDLQLACHLIEIIALVRAVTAQIRSGIQCVFTDLVIRAMDCAPYAP